ncbi:MAG TPA: hypothetical protein VN442_25580 [Bryobacteraceae bacterium]|nr:hypothetical protein [Bryobacteraceae bacterium]
MARGRSSTQDDLATLQMALVGYELERQKIDDKIKEIRARLGGRRAPATPAAAAASPAPAQPRKRNLSAAARKRIADAQKRRWAEHRRKAAQPKSAGRKGTASKAEKPAAKAADKA